MKERTFRKDKRTNIRKGLLLVLALPAALSIGSESYAARATSAADAQLDVSSALLLDEEKGDGQDSPGSSAAVGAVFATSASDARRNVSLALVSELLEEEGEGGSGASGDGMPIDVFATLVYGTRSYKTGNVPGFSSDTWGGVIGVDYRAPEYIVGVALDFAREKIDCDNHAGSQDTDELGLQLFGSYISATVEGLWLTAAARYSSLDIDTTRTFQTMYGEENAASGSTEGRTFGLLGGAGYGWPLPGNTSLNLSARLSWNDYRIDGYQESGAIPQGDFGESGNLRFEDDNYSTLDGMLTAELRHSIPIADGRLTPGLAVSYIHEFESDTRTIHAVSDVKNPSLRDVTFRTNEADQDYFRLGASLTADFTSGTSVSLTYSGMVGHDWRNENLLMLGLNQAF